MLVLGLAVVATPSVWRTSQTDVALYARYGEQLSAGSVPYRDFFVEYPPGALGPIGLPALFTANTESYGRLFVVENILILGVAIVVVAAAFSALGVPARRAFFGMLPLALSPLLLGPVTLQRFDLFAALLTIVAVVQAVRHRWVLAGVAVAAGTSIKLYPILMLFPLLVFAFHSGRRSAASRAVTGFLLAAALILCPFLAVSAGGMSHVLRYQFGRPLQVETLASSVALLGHLAAGFDVRLGSGFGSVNYARPHAALLHDAEKMLLVAVLATLFAASLSRARDAVGLVACSAAAICAVVTFGGVLSPQYMIWLLPIVPLVGGLLGRTGTVALLAVMLGTRVEYRDYYVALVRRLDPRSIEVLAARNAMLVTLCVIMFLAVAKNGRSSPRASVE